MRGCKQVEVSNPCMGGRAPFFHNGLNLICAWVVECLLECRLSLNSRGGLAREGPLLHIAATPQVVCLASLFRNWAIPQTLHVVHIRQAR